MRLGVLKLLDYPNCFKEAAQRKGLLLPSLETLARMEAAELTRLWDLALQADAALEAANRGGRGRRAVRRAAAAAALRAARAAAGGRRCARARGTVLRAADPRARRRRRRRRGGGGGSGAAATLAQALGEANPADDARCRWSYSRSRARCARLARRRGISEADAEELAAAIALSLGQGRPRARRRTAATATAAAATAESAARRDYEAYERGYPPLRRPADGGPHDSLMARHLTHEIYDELKDVRTASGFSIDDVIRPGVRLPHHPIGLVAGDSECYEMFPALFDVAVHDWHGWHRSQSPSHKTDTDASKLEIPAGWPAVAARCLSSLRIDVRRNFVGWMFTPSLNSTGRAGVERAGQALFEQLTEGQQGRYHPLGTLDDATRAQLKAEGVHFEAPDLAALHAGAGAAPRLRPRRVGRPPRRLPVGRRPPRRPRQRGGPPAPRGAERRRPRQRLQHATPSPRSIGRRATASRRARAAMTVCRPTSTPGCASRSFRLPRRR